jgi:ribonuclease HII
MNSFSLKELEFFHFSNVFGFDEAGRGPLAGPVTIAIVSFSKETLFQIKEGKVLQGLGDSKKISHKKRLDLFPKIKELAQLWCIQSVSSKYIDCFNINQAIFYGFGKAILDGNYNLNQSLYWKKFPEYISIPKADSTIISVAAASILAKVARDAIMQAYSKKIKGYGFEKHMGYGTQMHTLSIREKGLSKIHRRSYCKNIIL